LSRINSIIDSVIFYLIGLCLIALVAICFTQVVARYVFSASFSWAEEISITILLWSVWGGACLAVKSESHLRVAMFEKKLRPKTRFFLRLALNCIVILFLATIICASKTVINANENMTLMSLLWPVNIMYWSVPVGCLLMIYYCLRSTFSDWRNWQLPEEKKE